MEGLGLRKWIHITPTGACRKFLNQSLIDPELVFNRDHDRDENLQFKV